MLLKDLQKQVDEWVGQYEEGYWTRLEMVVQLAEELGEIAEIVLEAPDSKEQPASFEIISQEIIEMGKKARNVLYEYGPKKKKIQKGKESTSLERELCDMQMVLICFANREGIKDFGQLFQKMIKKKLYGRDKDRWTKK